MSIFEDHTLDVPVTAEYLRSIIDRRTCEYNDSDIARYNKILTYLAEIVTYNVEEPIYSYRINLKKIGCDGAPFAKEYCEEIDKLLEEGKTSNEIADWVNNGHPIVPNEKFAKFIKFFKERGFELRFKTKEFLKAENRSKEDVIVIKWGDEK